VLLEFTLATGGVLMADIVEIWEKPEAEEIYMLAGWRQWADAGSVSSGLPQYLIEHNSAHKIGEIRSGGFYLFQVPGTHDLVRPVVKFEKGYPESLQTPANELYYWGDEHQGAVVFIGDEPHLDIEGYIGALLEAARSLKVKRIITFGGVYGELPYDKERLVSAIYSQAKLKQEVENLAVTLSDYHGGASIGSYLCKRAAEREVEMIGFYAFVPTYDFSTVNQVANTIRIETDYKAWLGVMQRVNHMLKLEVDLSHLEKKSEELVKFIDSRVEEIDEKAPQLGVQDYMKRLSEEFEETSFDPADEFWEQELRDIFDKFEEDES
jgi:proteasome assembly chaperone (PAC2) family protein